MHCVDVGSEDPQAKNVVFSPYRFVMTSIDMVASKETKPKKDGDANAVEDAVRMLDSMGDMVAKYSSQPSDVLSSAQHQHGDSEDARRLMTRGNRQAHGGGDDLRAGTRSAR